ncbi:hypothetical protein H6G00_12105 [Leptolyngbya sp. FACHB-541]|uniref:hypothetical protein n=1 Tax=Leptolyngbya sp. FACHB-541 TaxID=2692810 RepID=UPI001683834B|nr:hypothetical protein [Leptolyngbya sp. FACHB-541]MBD1867880.1 hypothetical protein [Cyanobacteria bacterium FACHB-471]MBD1997361.1 hypothetical protein [Leptolyngbya sp. FACHB-541]
MTSWQPNGSSQSGLWICLSGVATVVMLAALVCSPLIETNLATQTLTIAPEDSAALQPIQIQPAAIGALRINITAAPAQNRWVSYEVQVRDAQGNLVASAIKDAGSESGYEDGEYWSETDLNAGLDIKSNQDETLTISVQVLDHTDPMGQDVEEPVSFIVSVTNGAVDSRFFWAGLFGTGSLTALSLRLRSKEV